MISWMNYASNRRIEYPNQVKIRARSIFITNETYQASPLTLLNGMLSPIKPGFIPSGIIYAKTGLK